MSKKLFIYGVQLHATNIKLGAGTLSVGKKGEMETKPVTSDNHQSSNTIMCDQSLIALLLRLIMKNPDISVNRSAQSGMFLLSHSNYTLVTYCRFSCSHDFMFCVCVGRVYWLVCVV